MALPSRAERRGCGGSGCSGEKKPSGHHLARSAVLEALFLSLQCQEAGAC